MARKIFNELKANTLEFEIHPLIKETGFREYDARWWFNGVNSEQAPELNLKGVQILGLSLGTLIHELGAKPQIVVGHDYRSISPSIKHALSLGLIRAGCQVLDVGLALSPMVYWSQFAFDIDCCAMVTASHNENGWTGVKMGANKPLTFGPDEMNRLKEITLQGKFKEEPGGNICEINTARNQYINSISENVQIKRNIRAVVACGNGTAGAFAPIALRNMGVDVIELDCQLDNSFPNYNPNPEDVNMLHAMSKAVKDHKADLALGFDGDGDRCGVIDNNGEEIFADKMGLMLARDLSKEYPNSKFVVDVKSTGLYQTDPILAQNGAQVEYYKTGHSYIKKRTQDIGALAGFEKSGHFFFRPPIGLGYDDGIIAAKAILQMLDNNPTKSLHDLKQDLKTAFTSITMSPYCADEIKYEITEKITAEYEARRKNTILGRQIKDINKVNGCRITLEDGSWLLIRASSNKPELAIVVESMQSHEDMIDLFRKEAKPTLLQHKEIGKFNQEI